MNHRPLRSCLPQAEDSPTAICWAEIGLLGLTSFFGMQGFRALPRVIFFIYRWMAGVSHIDMVLLAFGVFLICGLCAMVRRVLTPSVALMLTAGGVAACHVVAELPVSPTVELLFVTVGLGLYLLFLPIYLGELRGRSVQATVRFGFGLLLGFALDSIVRGVRDAWLLSGHWSGLLLLSLAFGLLLGFCSALVLPGARISSRSEGDFLKTIPVLAFGPFLLAQVLLYQNVAYLTVLSQWSRAATLGWVVLMNVLGMGAYVLVVTRAQRSWLIAVVGVTLLGSAMPLLAGLGGGVTMIAVTCGYVIIAGLLGLIMLTLAIDATHSALWRTAIGYTTGMFLFIFLLFILSLVLLSAPYNDGVTLPIQVATIIVGICALSATRQLPEVISVKAQLDWLHVWRSIPGPKSSKSRLTLLLLLLLLLLLAPIARETPSHRSGTGLPVRVMTYNLRSGINSDGQLSLEEQAVIIENSQAEIVGLQEVSRGFYLSGSFDTLTWLSERLGMPYIYGPTEILATGNAILSRYPIQESGYHLLPSSAEERVQARAYLWANIDLGDRELLVIVAHLHSNGGQVSPARRLQVQTLLEQWQGQQPALIMGDMNAYPDMPEIAQFRAAGLKDAFIEAGGAGDQAGYTFPATSPAGRIDYIWLSPELTASDLVIPPTTASDHLAVVATIANKMSKQSKGNDP